ncbi:MAG: hypothetical protein I3273_05075 [Candidatus Moeniiplasma glomeromycotorum]|nr:hypothetical protein [Candidatus Moeniiplasma glomeromycotorum]MCE8167915.1 hypothetical protein [Candidatus Moeniiplasma glomeromycotorum]MCE8169465.1 hypothetical protein [Candidatus Moeniiplasma glomeromycotorum]
MVSKKLTNMKAQEFIDKNFADKQIKEINLTHETFENLEGDLILQDYPNLKAIILPRHELTSLKVVNCPQLKQVNIRNNQLTKLEIAGNITELIASQNQLTTLDLTDCPNLKELIIPDNPFLSEIKGLNLSEVKNINITNTLVDLGKDLENLKTSKEKALEAVKTLKEAAENKELVLTEAIQNSIQAEEAVNRYLKKMEQEWRDFLANPQNSLPSFQIPETRKKAQQILIWIIEARVSGDYQNLIEKWTSRPDYQGEDDLIDNYLENIKKYLKVKNYLRSKEGQISLTA